MKVNINEIKKIAKTASEEILKYYKSDFDIAYKGGDPKSPVTNADLASEKIIKEGLAKYGWPILSEESADDKSRLNSEYVWIVDPLDGTKDFIERTGEFCVIIALVKNYQPILGVIYIPVDNICYFAEKGGGAYMESFDNKNRIVIDKESEFSKMVILTSKYHLGKLEEELANLSDIKEKKQIGSAGIKIARIAQGEAHIYINSSDKSSEWDTCAGELILCEAGGKITDMDGNDLNYNNENPRHLNGYVASNGTRHDDIIKVLKTL